MNILESTLSKKEYLAALKGCLMSPFGILNERMTGIVVGSFFSVAYYSPYEWNRKITHECNRAWGRVVETEAGTQVRFIRGKGLFSPFWLVALTVLFAIMIVIMASAETVGQIDLSGEMGIVWLMAAGISFAVCLITAFHSSVTEQGIEGAGEITRMLRDPGEYYC